MSDKRIKTRLMRVVLLALLAGLVLTGCNAVKSGTEATVGYIRGEYIQYTVKNVTHVCRATVSAMDQLKVTISEQACDELTGRVVARNAQDQKITIKIKRTGDELTKIAIQVGALGDEKQSKAIYNKIKAEL